MILSVFSFSPFLGFFQSSGPPDPTRYQENLCQGPQGSNLEQAAGSLCLLVTPPLTLPQVFGCGHVRDRCSIFRGFKTSTMNLIREASNISSWKLPLDQLWIPFKGSSSKTPSQSALPTMSDERNHGRSLSKGLSSSRPRELEPWPQKHNRSPHLASQRLGCRTLPQRFLQIPKLWHALQLTGTNSLRDT